VLVLSIRQSGKPQSRRYPPDVKASAVRMVMTLRAELGTKYGTVKRVAGTHVVADAAERRCRTIAM
jgi:transposase-like protein